MIVRKACTELYYIIRKGIIIMLNSKNKAVLTSLLCAALLTLSACGEEAETVDVQTSPTVTEAAATSPETSTTTAKPETETTTAAPPNRGDNHRSAQNHSRGNHSPRDDNNGNCSRNYNLGDRPRNYYA